VIHVYPTDEEHLHDLEGTCCKYGVEVDWSDPEAVVIHNSLADAGDLYKQGN
jgi:hypothetical protein